MTMDEQNRQRLGNLFWYEMFDIHLAIRNAGRIHRIGTRRGIHLADIEVCSSMECANLGVGNINNGPVTEVRGV